MITAKQIGNNIAAKAVAHLGEAEMPLGSGSNWSARIQIYLAYVYLTFAAAWCAAFASWVVGETLQEMGITPLHVCRTESSHEAVNFGIHHNTLQTAQSCQTGDLCVEMGGDGDAAENGQAYHHTTILLYVEPDGTVHWIAGNTHDEVAYGSCHISQCTLLRPYVLAN